MRRSYMGRGLVRRTTFPMAPNPWGRHISPMSDRVEDLSAALAGRYEIERELGSGGMATVYLADDVHSDEWET